MTRVLIPLASGVEEREAVITIDIFRRAQWDVVAAGLKSGPVRASRGVTIMPDKIWREVDPFAFDVLIIPGGAGGVDVLNAAPHILETIRVFDSSNRWIGAICAGPLVLQTAGILAGRNVTCHPAVNDKLTATRRLPERVVVDRNLVTSQGAGTTFEFALTIVKLIDGVAKAKSIMQGIVMTAGA